MAKVKCDSQAPCERCRENAINCFYSPSRRHGKQPWAKRVAEQHQRYFQSTMHGHHAQGSASMGSFLAFQPNPGASMLPMPSTLPPDAPTSPVKNFTFVNSPVVSPAADHPFSVGANFHFQNSWGGANSCVAPALSSSPASTSTLNMSEAGMSPLLEPAFRAPMHDCEAKALAMLQSLHMKPVENPTPGTHAWQQTPPLDKILHANRGAVSTLGELLQCPCAQQPHLALLCMATISKALSWYRLAINLSFKSSTQPSKTRNESSSPHSHTHSYSMTPGPNMSAAATNAIPDRTYGRPRASTIQIGVFDLEEEDEAMLVRSVVITEVKKVARLVDFMTVSYTHLTLPTKRIV